MTTGGKSDFGPAKECEYQSYLLGETGQVLGHCLCILPSADSHLRYFHHQPQHLGRLGAYSLREVSVWISAKPIAPTPGTTGPLRIGILEETETKNASSEWVARLASRGKQLCARLVTELSGLTAFLL